MRGAVMFLGRSLVKSGRRLNHTTTGMRAHLAVCFQDCVSCLPSLASLCLWLRFLQRVLFHLSCNMKTTNKRRSGGLHNNGRQSKAIIQLFRAGSRLVVVIRGPVAKNMARDDLLTSPFEAIEGDRRELETVSSTGPSQHALIDSAAQGAAHRSAHDLAQQMSAQDFSGCCSTLMQDMKLTQQKDLLPLLAGVLQHVGNREFPHGQATKKRSGAFSKSVRVASDEAEKLEESESFRRLRRAAFSSDARCLFQQELSRKGYDLHQVDAFDEAQVAELAPILLRFGFPANRAGMEDALQVLSEPSEQRLNEQEANDEPCGF